MGRIKTDIYAEDYREQYRLHGQPVRVFARVELREEQIEAQPDGREPRQAATYRDLGDLGEVRIMTTETTTQVVSPEGFQFQQGETKLFYLPDELPMADGYRVAFPQRKMRRTATVIRGSGSTDTLPSKGPIAEVVAVQEIATYEGDDIAPLESFAENGTTYTPGIDCTWMPFPGRATGEQVLTWGDNAPAEGTRYTVDYWFHPLYEVLGILQQHTKTDPDGVPLPQSVRITLVQP
jgi:hypothetical protein